MGGVETEVSEYPWQAGLVDKGSRTVWCGGALGNSRSRHLLGYLLIVGLQFCLQFPTKIIFTIIFPVNLRYSHSSHQQKKIDSSERKEIRLSLHRTFLAGSVLKY